MADPTTATTASEYDDRRLTLWPYALRYINARKRRGEINIDTSHSQGRYLFSLAQSYGARPLRGFSVKAVDRWLEQIGHFSPGSRRNMLSAVRGFSRWLVAERLIERDVTIGAARIRTPRRVSRSMNQSQVAQLWEGCQGTRDDLMVWLGLGLGLRCVEMARLDLGDYDQIERTLHVRGKGSHERVLPVPDEVRLAIASYLGDRGQVQGPLLRSHVDPMKGLTASAVSTNFGRIFRNAGLKQRAYDGLSGHALRHTAATDVLTRCRDLTIVRDMLGHANIQTTSIYLGKAELEKMRVAMAGRNYRWAVVDTAAIGS